ncbi:MAG: tetratricopeptide repeat protein [Deltaproteobacteria bacterium]|nr:tetratricopeptide repeat protein [Deltaproteobacteria bacterium]
MTAGPPTRRRRRAAAALGARWALGLSGLAMSISGCAAGSAVVVDTSSTAARAAAPIAAAAATAATGATAPAPAAVPPGREPSAEATRAALQAEVLLQQGDVPAAIAELRAACRHDDRSAFLHRRLAEALLVAGDAEAADVAAATAVERAGDDVDAIVLALQARAAARALLGDGEAARAALRRALAARPGDAGASAALAELLVQGGALAEAEAVVAAWMARAGGAVDGWVALARVFADRGEVDRAFVHLQRALSIRKQDGDALRLQRDLQWATGRFDDAARTAAALARHDGDGPDVRTGLLTALALSAPDEARALARAWLADDDGEGSRLLVADAFERAGLLDDALAALPVTGGSDVLTLERARLLLARGQAGAARAAACAVDAGDRAAPHRATPGADGGDGHDVAVSVFAAALCARATAGDGAADDAIARLLDVLASHGPAERLLDALAAVAPQARPSRQAAARQAMDALIARRPPSPAEAWSIAFVQDAVGAPGEARAVLQAQLLRHPDDPALTLAWARLLEQQATSPAQALAAVELVERLVERRGASVDALNLLAFATAEQDAHGDEVAAGPSSRRADDARAWAWRAVVRAPLSGAVIDSWGWALLGRGDVDDAVVALRRATRLLPDDGEVWFHRAVAEQRALDRGAAGASVDEARLAAARARALLVAAPSPRAARLLRRLDAATTTTPTTTPPGGAR